MKKVLKIIFYNICVLSRFISDKKARILMYHSFKVPGVFFNVREEDFIWQIRYLKNNKYHFVSMTDLANKIKNKDDLSKIIALTFDDGHSDFLEVALPILIKENIPVTLYWPTNLPDNRLYSSQGIKCPILDLNSIRELLKNSLIEIGSHGVSHRELTFLTDIQINEELKKSFDIVFELTNKKVSFAYPRGKYSEIIANNVKENGYDSAVIVSEGFVGIGASLFELPRLSVDSSVDKLGFKAKLSPFYGLYLYLKSCIK